MSLKRYKRVAKALSFYKRTFNVDAPYKVLMDGDYIAVALEGSIKLKEQVPRLLNAPCELYVTKCIVADLEQRAQQDVFWRGALMIAKTMSYLKCCHPDLAKPTDCIRLICAQHGKPKSATETKEPSTSEGQDNEETTETKTPTEAETQKPKLDKAAKKELSKQKQAELAAQLKARKHLVLGVQHTHFRNYVRDTFPFIPILWLRGKVPMLDLPGETAKKVEVVDEAKKHGIDEATRRKIRESKLALMNPEERERYLAKKQALKLALEKEKRKAQKLEEKRTKRKAKLQELKKQKKQQKQESGGQQQDHNETDEESDDAQDEHKDAIDPTSGNESRDEDASHEGGKRRIRHRKRRHRRHDEASGDSADASGSEQSSSDFAAGASSWEKSHEEDDASSLLGSKRGASETQNTTSSEKRVKRDDESSHDQRSAAVRKGKSSKPLDGIKVGNAVWRGVVETTTPGSAIRTFKLEKGFQPEDVSRSISRKNYTENSKAKDKALRDKRKEEFVAKAKKKSTAI